METALLAHYRSIDDIEETSDGPELRIKCIIASESKHCLVLPDLKECDLGEITVGSAAGEGHCAIVLENSLDTPALIGISIQQAHDVPYSVTVTPAELQIPPRGKRTFNVNCHSPLPCGQFLEKIQISQINSLTGQLSRVLYEIPAFGTFSSPDVSCNVTHLEFGDISLGSTKCQEILLRNNSNAAVRYNIQAGNTKGSFQIQPCFGQLKPKSLANITVIFKPSRAWNFLKTIFILFDNALPISVDLVGTCFSPFVRPAVLRHDHVRQWRERVSLSPQPCSQNRESRFLDFLELSNSAKRTQPKMAALNKSFLDFSTADLGSTHEVSVQLQNLSDEKLVCDWDAVLAEGNNLTFSERSFSISPAQVELSAGDSATFVISFNPARPSEYFFRIFDCVVSTKRNRSFRLVNDAGIVPPQTLSLAVQG